MSKPNENTETYQSEAFYSSDENVYEEDQIEGIEEITIVSAPPPVPSQIIDNSASVLRTTFQEGQNKSIDKVNAQQVLILMDKLEVQKALCVKVDEAIVVMKEHNNQMETNMKKLYRSLDSIHYQQKEQTKEQKRHNHEMEKLRKEEIEFKIKTNKKIIELKELRIKLLEGKENK